MSVKKHLLQNLSFLKKSRESQRFLGFSFFIYCSWGGLGATLPFWFDINKALPNLAVYYSLAAILGATGVLWINLIDKLEIRKLSLLMFFICFLGGIFLLFPTSMFLSMLAGVCKGLGGIFHILVHRTWLDSWEDEKEKTYIIGWNQFIFLGITGLLTALIGFSISGLKAVLFSFQLIILIFSLTPFISYFLLRKASLRTVKKPVISTVKKIYECFQSHKNLMIWASVCSLFMGLRLGIIGPYQPILLNKIGFEPAKALYLISIGSFLKIFFQPIFSIMYQPHKKELQIFVIGIVYAMALGMWGMNFPTSYLIPFVLITFIIEAACMFFENNIYYTIFPKQWSLFLFTLSNIGFYIGSALGNLLGSMMISNREISYFIFLTSIFIVIDVLLLGRFIRSLTPRS